MRIKEMVIVLAAILCCNAFPAWSGGLTGYYTEEEIRSFPALGGPDQIHRRQTWYSGNKMLKDDAWYGKTLADFDAGKIYMLDDAEDIYIEVSTEFIRKNAADGLSSFGIPNPDGEGYAFPEDLYVRTETTKQIGRWQCYQVMTNPKYRDRESPYVVFWYSTDIDFPVEVYGEQLKNLFGDSSEARGLFKRITEFEGYPVRTETHGTVETTITTLTKIEARTDIDPAKFELPEGYRGIPLPENINQMPIGP